MTRKQVSASQKVVENGGNVSKAMRDAGYSFNTAKTPQKLTKSKGWQELVDLYLPENLLLEALNSDIKNNPGNRKPLLDLAFKLRGRLDKEHSQVDGKRDFSEVVAEHRAKYLD